MKKRIITLLTDFGLKDPYAGIMKGVIYSINPDACIIDLTHEITRHDIFEGAFSLLQASGYFPEGTIHVAVVDPGVGGHRKNLIIETPACKYVVPDNGIAALCAEKSTDNIKIYEIARPEYCLKNISSTFHGRDIFAPVAAYLSKGVKPEKIGNRINRYQALSLPETKRTGNLCIAEIIHVDRFGNLITNAGIDMVDIIDFIEIKGEKIKSINRSYEDSEDGLLAVKGSAGFLEISVRGQSAACKLNAGKGDLISIYLK